jgi:hypothetical protein
MELLKRFRFRWLPTLAAATIVLLMATVGTAQLPLIIDGRDEANLAGDGNHGTFHNPPVTFAFTFGGVSADNPTVGPGDPPMPCCDKSFNYTGTDFGGLGFGISPDLVFDASQVMAIIDLTVNPNNTLQTLVLNLKDRDPVPPIFSNIEEHQYNFSLGAPGTKRLKLPLAAPNFTNNPTGPPTGSGPDFDPNFGLAELQLQYAFSEGGSGHIMDLTVHRIAIGIVPEPGIAGLAGFGALAMSVLGVRRRRVAAE